MTTHVLLLILTSVSLTSFAQIVLKAGMSDTTVLNALDAGMGWPAVWSIATQPLVVGGLLLYFGAAFVWLLVLARVQVSLAYPFVGLGFVLTMLLGWAIHGDSLSVARVAGTLIISLGVVILARS
jgi:drug/metabolite transporter (DMT)-like permease